MLEELVGEFDECALLADKCVKFFSAHWTWEIVSFFHTSVVHGLIGMLHENSWQCRFR